MKHLWVVGLAWGLASSDACAQITEIHNRLGQSGTHVQLPLDQPVFEYQSSISGQTASYQVQFEVLHNGVQRFANSALVVEGGAFFYAMPVVMADWGLKAGDTITFVCKVIDLATGATVATHHLYGDVVGP